MLSKIIKIRYFLKFTSIYARIITVLHNSFFISLCMSYIAVDYAFKMFTLPLTEMSTRNIKIMFLGSKVRLVGRADNLTAISEPIV
jgi:hypothetical protein